MAAQSQELSIRERTDNVIATLTHPAFLEQIEQSLPENVSLQRFVSVAKTAVRTNPKLVDADQNTLFASIVKCAQDGLFPDGREAALVIFKDKVSYLPMIGGYRKIAGEYGWSIETSVVYEGDEFDYEQGLDVKLVHRRARPGGERGDLVNAYAIARHRDGRRLFVVLDEEEVEKCRQVSRAKDDGPWVQWTERMWEKTAGKRLFKELPLDPNDARIDRLLREGVFADPINALYGVNKTDDLRPDPEPPTESLPPDGEGPPIGAKQEEAATTDGATPAASSTDVEDGVWTPVDDEPEVDEAEVEKAAQTTVKGSVYDGQTFTEIAAAENGHGLTWLLVQLKKTAADAPNRATLELYVSQRLPELWAKYETWRAEQ